jgi:[ribosomal protein S18]-alanine N-acetyltransferase
MHYHLYRPDDFSQLYAIEQICFQPPFRFARRYIQQLVSSPNSATWIAEQDCQMTGFAIVEWSEEGGRTLAYIQTLEVTPSHRQQGIAGELLLHCESSAFEAGSQVLWLHVAEDNAPAIHLYQTHGYLLQGREENYYALQISALIYAKPLV